MTINAVINTALASLSIPTRPSVYTVQDGEVMPDTYITYNYFTSGDDFADNAPGLERYSVQVHYFCPLITNSLAVRKQIKRLLFAADFTWPSVTDATDGDGQHWVFECERLMGV